MPPEIAFLTKLEELSIVDCALPGNVATVVPSAAFAQSLTNLRLLSVEGNLFTGTVPAYLADMSNLQYLKLMDNPSLEGTIPTELANLSSLKELDISNTNLTGAIPSDVCALPFLAGIIADCGKITCCAAN